jgi:hypothetical protein
MSRTELINPARTGLTARREELKMTKRQREQLVLAVTQLADASYYRGEHLECDYCDQDATWLHFKTDVGDRGIRPVDEDRFACDEHVRYLNPSVRLGRP